MERINVGALFLVFVVLLFHGTCYAAVPCTSNINNKLIGIEFVADSCPTSSNQTMHYIDTAIQCTNGTVSLYAHYGDDLTTPGFLVYYWGTVSGYRVFGNDLGNHIIAVTPNFGTTAADTIDGIPMYMYAAGSFYQNVINKILYPQAVSNDADNDHYINCDDCNDTNFAINPGAAEICSDSIDNNCDNLIDCQDEPTCGPCQSNTDIDPLNTTRDSKLCN